jgi:PKHD-type hydroxylase
MTGEWCYWNEYFSKEKCKLILDEVLKMEPKDSQIGVGGGQMGTDTKIRKSKVRFIEDTNPDFQWLFDDLWKLGMRCNKDFFNFHLTNLSFIQIAEYDESYEGEYKSHQDVFWITDDPRHRKLTCVVQLTDPSEYEGGDFKMSGLNSYPSEQQETEMKKLGSAIVFPSFVYHQANPVTKGTRYSLAAWFEGPKWV